MNHLEQEGEEPKPEVIIRSVNRSKNVSISKNKEEVLKNFGSGPISSRSRRSERSGIMAKLNDQANAGNLRFDNVAFYEKLLNQNQPPFTAMES